jgi:UDP-N-acetylglucosamine transferase subunit ALG13
MILVLLGTNPYDFSRLARAADEYAQHSGEGVMIQLGHTDFRPQRAQHFAFMNREQLLDKIAAAEVLVTQGGFGSIADGLLAGKPVVAVPRQPELHEAPDRQEELVRELERLGRVVGVYDIDKLPAAIQQARKMAVKTGQGNQISRLIQQFIREH